MDYGHMFCLNAVTIVHNFNLTAIIYGSSLVDMKKFKHHWNLLNVKCNAAVPFVRWMHWLFIVIPLENKNFLISPLNWRNFLLHGGASEQFYNG